MAQHSIESILADSAKSKYDRIVNCRYCGETGLMFDESKAGNAWLYEISEFLTAAQLEQMRNHKGLAQFLREVAVGRDPEKNGELGTKFVLILKNKPHPACKLEGKRLELEVPDVQTGTVSEDELLTTNDMDPQVEEDYGLMGYKVVDEG